MGIFGPQTQPPENPVIYPEGQGPLGPTIPPGPGAPPAPPQRPPPDVMDYLQGLLGISSAQAADFMQRWGDVSGESPQGYDPTTISSFAQRWGDVGGGAAPAAGGGPDLGGLTGGADVSAFGPYLSDPYMSLAWQTGVPFQDAFNYRFGGEPGPGLAPGGLADVAMGMAPTPPSSQWDPYLGIPYFGQALAYGVPFTDAYNYAASQGMLGAGVPALSGGTTFDPNFGAIPAPEPTFTGEPIFPGPEPTTTISSYDPGATIDPTTLTSGGITDPGASYAITGSYDPSTVFGTGSFTPTSPYYAPTVFGSSLMNPESSFYGSSALYPTALSPGPYSFGGGIQGLGVGGGFYY
jgi:hypothetical protein